MEDSEKAWPGPLIAEPAGPSASPAGRPQPFGQIGKNPSIGCRLTAKPAGTNAIPALPQEYGIGANSEIPCFGSAPRGAAIGRPKLKSSPSSADVRVAQKSVFGFFVTSSQVQKNYFRELSVRASVFNRDTLAQAFAVVAMQSRRCSRDTILRASFECAAVARASMLQLSPPVRCMPLAARNIFQMPPIGFEPTSPQAHCVLSSWC